MRQAILGVITAGVLLSSASGWVGAQAPPADVRRVDFSEADARQWLTYLSSDLMQGREVFTEGYGLASSYIAEQLRDMGVEPLGQDGTYFQPVVRRGYRVTQDSSVTVTARGETRTFQHGDHVMFSLQSGAAQTLTFTGVEFAGYGLGAAGGPSQERRDLRGTLALVMPGVPQAFLAGGGRLSRALGTVTGRTSALVRGSSPPAAAIGFSTSPIVRVRQDTGAGAPDAAAGARGGGAARTRPDLTTVLPMDREVPPTLTADEEFFKFVLGGVPGKFEDLRAKAQAGEPLPAFQLADVKVSIDINTRYQIVSTERTQNVVGLVRGSDAQLRDHYVMFGAHLDHVGYAVGAQAKGRTNVPVEDDPIWNGADDDGSGTTAVLAIAKAFASGPRPKRSAVFVWHAGEEEGLLGSTYMAEHPVVPLDRVEAMFNIDMIGRNRDDNPSMADTVFVIGADRISTDLHNVIVASNGRSPRPLTLDYEYNDGADPNSFYTRSDHYSYAAKGIPSAFFFTGTHVDYHANTDTVDKILFPKLVRIADMIYRSGYAVADRAEPLVRDNLGPRSGRGFSGPIGRQAP